MHCASSIVQEAPRPFTASLLPRQSWERCSASAFRTPRHHCCVGPSRRSKRLVHATNIHAANESSRVTSATPATKPKVLLTVEEAQRIARERGLELEVRTYGPVYFLTCRDEVGGTEVAVSSGFTAAPFRLMHCDSLRVDTSQLSDRDGRTGRQRGVGLGLLMCSAVIALGHEAGCRTAEILAINDGDVMHRRLCSYYHRMGFRTVVEVGDRGLRDLPHLLVWGGVGTRMNADIPTFLAKWSDPIRDRK